MVICTSVCRRKSVLEAASGTSGGGMIDGWTRAPADQLIKLTLLVVQEPLVGHGSSAASRVSDRAGDQPTKQSGFCSRHYVWVNC